MQATTRTLPIVPLTAAASAATTTAAEQPTSGGGVQGFIGDTLRGVGAGYAAAANSAAVQTDKASIYPIESTYQAVTLLAEKTKGVPVVGKVTGLLPTIAGFGLLVVGLNASGLIRAPGDTALDATHALADMIDGQKTLKGWSLGWGVRGDAMGVGSALTSLGYPPAPQAGSPMR